MLHMHDWYGPRGFGGFGFLEDLLALLLLVGLIALGIVFAARLLGNRNPPAAKTSDNAMAIARERYAKGEISAEEFEAIKKTLGP
ncbi:SHOCT domain-containing protein [Allomeiothermus silvanus]|uniref:SHOCT domain-containing protein n=1 Tax=Allomeiothermus silvanus TaxID=52022 RepID=UPI0023F171BD|nr:SHOCT domain-containing protein [Allomeiothermus silvanus]